MRLSGPGPGRSTAPAPSPWVRPVARSVAVALVAGGMVVGGAGASSAIDGDDCVGINQVDAGESDVTDFDAEGSPIRALQIGAAQARVTELTGRVAGSGVTVAVLDSGVRDQSGLSVRTGDPAPGATRAGALVWHQGTLVAGVIAAAPEAGSEPGTELPVGIAPAAKIFDQRIYDTGLGVDDGLVKVGPDSVAAGLEAIAPLIRKRGIDIVTVAVSGPASDRLRAAVDLVTGRGAIIVAASGARADAAPGSPEATFRDGEDYADTAFPAGYAKARTDAPANPRVVSVTTTAAPGEAGGGELDPSDYILFSSAIDVAAPSAGAVSLGINDRFCSIREPSVAVATAEVSGVLALLKTVYRTDTPEQLIARLEATASGATASDTAPPNTRVGQGIIQPLEALTRPLAPAPDGGLPGSVLPAERATPAVLPVPDPDVLSSTRENAVWWGLLGGGALLVLVLLRPVLSRRHG